MLWGECVTERGRAYTCTGVVMPMLCRFAGDGCGWLYRLQSTLFDPLQGSMANLRPGQRKASMLLCNES